MKLYKIGVDMLGSKAEIRGTFDFEIETHIKLLFCYNFFVTISGSSFTKCSVIHYKQHIVLRVGLFSNKWHTWNLHLMFSFVLFL